MQPLHLRSRWIDPLSAILQIVFRVIRPEGELASFQEQQSGTMKRKFAGDRAGKDSAIIGDSNIMKKWSEQAERAALTMAMSIFAVSQNSLSLSLSRVIHDRRIELCTGKIWNDCSWIWSLLLNYLSAREKFSTMKKMKI